MRGWQISVFAMLLLGSPIASAWRADLDECRSNEPARAIEACTRIIEQAGEADPSLIAALSLRFKAFDRLAREFSSKWKESQADDDFEAMDTFYEKQVADLRALARLEKHPGRKGQINDLIQATESLIRESRKLKRLHDNRKSLDGERNTFARVTALLDSKGRNLTGEDRVALDRDLNKLITDFTQAIDNAPGDASPHYKRGIAYYFKSEWQLAIGDFNSAFRLDPAGADAFAKLGLTYRGAAHSKLGNYDNAMSDLNAALRRSSEDSMALFERARASLLSKNDYDAALRDLDMAIRLMPKDAANYRLRGFVRQKKNQLPEALADYEEALRLGPPDAMMLSGRGDIWVEKEEFDRAISDYDAALKLDPKGATALRGRGIAWYQKRSHDRALADLDEALKINPKSAWSLRVRATVFSSRGRAGDLERAKADVEASLGIEPNQPELEKLKASIESDIADQKAGKRLAGKRVALVVGNSTYANAPHLRNPANDAKAIAEALRRLGFSDVTERYDLGKKELGEELKAFGDKAAKADWAVAYFAGHGIQVDGQTYLIPTDAKLARDAHVTDETVPLGRVLAKVDDASQMRLAIVDACRENPFVARMKKEGGTRSLGRGLARVENTGGVLVAYAARDGQVAEDGDGEHSPFTQALLEHLEQPGLEIGLLFRNVRDAVFKRTDGNQEPYTYGSIPSEEFYFKAAKR